MHTYTVRDSCLDDHTVVADGVIGQDGATVFVRGNETVAVFRREVFVLRVDEAAQEREDNDVFFRNVIRGLRVMPSIHAMSQEACEMLDRIVVDIEHYLDQR